MKLKTKRVEVGYTLPRKPRGRKDRGTFKVVWISIDIGGPNWEKNAEIKARLLLDAVGREYETIFAIDLAPGEKEKVLAYLENRD